jgi:hypothetical protein
MEAPDTLAFQSKPPIEWVVLIETPLSKRIFYSDMKENG